MGKYKKPVIEENKLGKNPFLQHLKIVVSKIELPGQWVNDGGIIVPADMEIEKASFCKVFSDSDRRMQVVRLSPRAKDLLLWLVYELEPGCDWIWINKQRYMDENKIASYNTYNGAVNELIREGFLVKCAAPANVFWINPHYFFNGNRAKTFPKNVVKR